MDGYHDAIMSIEAIQHQLDEHKRMIVAQRDELEELRRSNHILRNNLSAVEESTAKVMADRERLQRRVTELEATNKRLVDMLWGRRSERRVADPNQLLLPGSED
jgi:chromosome segregation ATPase